MCKSFKIYIFCIVYYSIDNAKMHETYKLNKTVYICDINASEMISYVNFQDVGCHYEKIN